MKFNVSIFVAASLALSLAGCGGALSGQWTGKVVPKPGATTAGKGYSETKPSLSVQGNGKYEANMQEVRSAGSWKAEGTTLTLTPETYMGMTKEQLSGGSKGKAGNVDGIFKDYVLTVSQDQKSLVHEDNSGVTTYSR